MRKLIYGLAAVGAGVLLAPIAAGVVLACGPADVCADVGSSLNGEVIVGGIALSWSTDQEDSTVAGYYVWRYDCATPGTCATFVAAAPRAGLCSSEQPYEYIDHPAEPLSQWSYFVEVRRTDGTVACAHFVTP